MKFRPRLGRLERLFTRCPIYFITARTYRWRRILDNQHVLESFKSLAHRAGGYRVLVGSYVIMPDHLHLFAAFNAESPSLSMWMKSLRNTLSRTLRQTGVRPPHWQDGFFDHVMRSEESYRQKWNYVRDNPVRVGLVGRAEDWPYQGEIHQLSRRSMTGVFRRS